ncbi:MAG: formate dehydrogenase accessory sulfurtransferase FdhD [Candidatus Thermoplasmatota archaeon]|nr:formate dehydrogenase accessory sulfurtransferase FdhD [Candidatus Thermoplasmatota archaeon]
MISGESKSGSKTKTVVRYTGSPERSSTTDRVTVEEPLDIMVRNGTEQPLHIAYIMRTPVMDDYLSAGFLFSEGIIRSRSDILGFEGIDSNGISAKNSLTVLVADHVHLDPKGMQRQFFVNSSCGICGKSSINETFMRMSGMQRSECTVHAETILQLPKIMREYQSIFSQTGGIHAAALFSLEGNLMALAEDIGRHNAVDKIVGYMLLNGLINHDLVLQVSGRVGFEIAQKAALARIPILSSISAPSSLAIETCEILGLTLACFVREDRFSIYSNSQRIL